MPAALRGGAQTKAKPRAKAPSSPRKTRGASKAQPAYAPGKLGAVRGLGLSPGHALIAAGGVLALTLVVALSTGDRAEKIGQGTQAALGRQFAGLGFRLNAVHVQGASPAATADILAAAGVYKDQPVLGLDLEALRARVEAVGWVEEARIVRLLPDTLIIAISERRQLAVWQHNGSSRVIDAEGQVIPEANPLRAANLPLVVGQGADQHAAAILPRIAARPRLMSRVEALVRVDDRRWDLRLKDGSLVQLPAVDEEAALIQLEQLDQRSRILELGFARIDLRDPTMVAVRPRDQVRSGGLVADGA
ncbi:cell division protein FtsQ/DivIB [Phenylobacterium sp.]|uniref:cell division protein FtsQ/DivIB n=1 Tax=Phenylobacterium sp. TaxID=1871053 RepID=UPI00272F1C91|nr:cell division protein FtsQ/DivIB [Phenylobacterium sp.]MDP1618794.1 cell division protein FtsQ/DivIB [Phenylobacterium sp.]MDP1987043.1 cell division protein FtsQ/DivIB [Phenylobacterium sp.]